MNNSTFDINKLKTEVIEAEDAMAREAEDVCEFIWNHPEPGDEEFESAGCLMEHAQQHGFRVTKEYCGLPTAFLAEYGEEGPVVAFLAEFDALPGFGDRSPSPLKNGYGHACGHNFMGASTFAAAASLKEIVERHDIKCRIRFVGCTAEETLGHKMDMCKKGVFSDVDAAFQFHLGGVGGNCVRPYALARDEYRYEFTGHASHAGHSPEDGINAMEAVTLTFAGINALRQHTTPEARIHGIINEAGKAVNIVPEFGACTVGIRTGKKDTLESLCERVHNCARGAALMTGCELKIVHICEPYYDVNHDETLIPLMKANLEQLGITEFSNDNIFKAASSDIGNVSYECPVFYGVLSTKEAGPYSPHEQGYLEICASDYVKTRVHVAAKAMAMGALDVISMKG